MKIEYQINGLINSPFKDIKDMPIKPVGALGYRLKKRLNRHREELFTFLEFNNVSPYNNHEEQ